MIPFPVEGRGFVLTRGPLQYSTIRADETSDTETNQNKCGLLPDSVLGAAVHYRNIKILKSILPSLQFLKTKNTTLIVSFYIFTIFIQALS